MISDVWLSVVLLWRHDSCGLLHIPVFCLVGTFITYQHFLSSGLSQIHAQLGVLCSRLRMIPWSPIKISGLFSPFLLFSDVFVHVLNIPKVSTFLNSNSCPHSDSKIPLHSSWIVLHCTEIQKMIPARKPGQLQHCLPSSRD